MDDVRRVIHIATAVIYDYLTTENRAVAITFYSNKVKDIHVVGEPAMVIDKNYRMNLRHKIV